MTLLYDYRGKPIETPKKPDKNLQGTLPVVTLRENFFEYVSRGLTPVRLSRILEEADNGDTARQAELFTEIEEKDAHIFSQFQIRKQSVVGLGFTVTPYDDSAQSEKVATDVGQMMTRLLDNDTELDMLDALSKGYSALQMGWEVSEGQADIRSLVHIDPRMIRFEPEDNYSPRVLTERDRIHGEPFPSWKIVFHRYKARSGYDTRAGIMRVCSWMYLLKNYALKDLAVFSELYAMPMRLGKHSPGASKEAKEALIKAVRSLGTDAAGIISSDTEIQFIEAAKTSSVDLYERFINLCDSQNSKAIRGQVHTANSESQGIGTYGMGKTDEGISYELLEADCISLARTSGRQLIQPYVGFNHGWDTPLPGFSFNFRKPDNLEKLAPVYQVLTQIGHDISMEHIAERFGIPMRREGETPLRPQASSFGGMKMLSLKNKPDGLSQPAGGAEQAQKYLDDLVMQAVGAIDGAKDFSDAGERLYKAFPKMDPETFQEVLARSVFSSAMSGYADAEKEMKD